MRKLTVVLASLSASCALAQDAAPPLKLGMIADFSSVYSDAVGKGTAAAIEMAIEDFGGSVLGRKIVLLQADHLNKPDVGANLARQWIDIEKVDAFVETQNSSVALAVLDLARRSNKANLLVSPGSADLTGKLCSPITVHWSWDTYMAVNATVRPLTEKGLKSWYYIIPDANFGRALTADAKKILPTIGGTFVGETAVPTGTADFSSALLLAQGSGAQVIAIGGGGQDASNAIKQAAEFGLTPKQQLAGVITSTSEVVGAGLQAAQGMMLPETFYWDLNDRSRAWSKRFREKTGRMPNANNAGSYSAVTHLLKAIKAVGGTAGDAVVAKMRELPIEDLSADRARLREDGRVMRDVFLFQVKAPAESSGPDDVYKLVATVPAEKAFRPLSESECPLVKK
ncbi:MAG: hypothetical protein JWR08_1418 [Enterovirga sp.]|nr:hypothetical protein [Enterovirga sp.]